MGTETASSAPRRTVLVGTSGFSYDDWIGTWYPAGMPKGEMLAFYAARFGALEINASYYRVPPPRTAHSMIARAGGRLRFAVKAPGSMTHRRELSATESDAFRRFLEPFTEAQTLAAVLFQFPAGFQHATAAVRHLHALGRAFADYATAVELRSGTWDAPEAATAASELFTTRVVVDQPHRPELSAPGRIAPPGPLAYLRFHGRNAETWYDPDDAHQRYRYRYGETGVRELTALVSNAAEGAQTTLAFFNNHPDGHAPHDAAALAESLGVARTPDIEQRDLFRE